MGPDIFDELDPADEADVAEGGDAVDLPHEVAGAGRPRHIKDDAPLRELLHQYFGFNEFRPLQEEIIADAISGRDVLAVLPTGGGKSLCFQLPALVRPGLTVVVSPLIALMKDQVDALLSMGISATFLNSSLDAVDARVRIADIEQGNVRLLYVAPERLMMAGMLSALARWNVSLIAVDEAHCVSEWGHDFRPEYRQLASVREQFPGVPMMALTATATPHVQDDIVRALKLKSARKYVASFNRPNLTYRVLPRKDAFGQVLKFVQARPDESGIVYCLSRRGAEDMAASLRDAKVKAAAYHAGMDSAERSDNQEKFLRDDVNVICATIAFGMGINKPNVRYVIHADLPRNIEGYYQETGRAGRDSIPSECLLLFARGDVSKQMRFIDEKPDVNEQALARKQLFKMVEYADAPQCRRKFLLGYFGEQFTATPCGACDNCTTPRASYDGTLDAQKFLSCVYRIRERNANFKHSVKYVAEVLTGAESDLIRGWEHNTLSTYGIGKEHSRDEWQAVGRQLVQLGLLRELADGKYTRIELAPEGREVLMKRKTVSLVEPAAAPAERKSKGDRADRAGEKIEDYDLALFERLRGLRKRLADERNVPPYIVFSDVSLRQMARAYPRSSMDFSRISGVGEKKRVEYGDVFVNEIQEYLKTNSAKTFAASTNAGSTSSERSSEPRAPKLGATARMTLQMYRNGKDVPEIARERNLVESTIVSHLVTAIEVGQDIDIGAIMSPQQHTTILGVFEKIGMNNLTGAFELAGGEAAGFNYGMIKIARALRQRTSPDAGQGTAS
jgi:ATP-dependent DNA helicase RecQ